MFSSARAKNFTAPSARTLQCVCHTPSSYAPANTHSPICIATVVPSYACARPSDGAHIICNAPALGFRVCERSFFFVLVVLLVRHSLLLRVKSAHRYLLFARACAPPRCWNAKAVLPCCPCTYACLNSTHTLCSGWAAACHGREEGVRAGGESYFAAVAYKMTRLAPIFNTSEQCV